MISSPRFSAFGIIWSKSYGISVFPPNTLCVVAFLKFWNGDRHPDSGPGGFTWIGCWDWGTRPCVHRTPAESAHSMTTVASSGPAVHFPSSLGKDNQGDEGMQMAAGKIQEYPRIVHLTRCPSGGFGFEIIGDGPFYVQKVHSAAHVSLWLLHLPSTTPRPYSYFWF